MDESPKVISIRGGEIAQPGVPVPDVVEELERLLEIARSGDMQGFAIAFIHADDATSMRRSGAQTRALVGALEIIKIDAAADAR